MMTLLSYAVITLMKIKSMSRDTEMLFTSEKLMRTAKEMGRD